MSRESAPGVRVWQRLAIAGLALQVVGAPAGAAVAEDEVDAEASAGVSFDGLVRVEGARVAAAYIDPTADFGAFRRVVILEPYVAFRSNWQRDQRRSQRRSVSTRDMEGIKTSVARLFREVFTETLEADDGFEVVDVANHDVLLLRPAIIDLDVTAPDTGSVGRSRTFAASAGAATLYLELFDSVSGKIIGRAIDRRSARSAGGSVRWSSRVANTAEARQMFGRWARILRDFLDQHYAIDSKASGEAE